MLAGAGGFATAARAQAAQGVAAELPSSSVSDVMRLAGYCNALAATAWPNTAAARRALLQRLEALRQPCMNHGAYLAMLGALWLEEGEPAQALLWLERSLLLDPTALGTQADHALALAALGETAARDALAREWRERTDIPPALRQRLALGPEANSRTKGNGPAPLPSTIKPPDGWVSYREASLVGGYETNLDHSPRLDEITITPPGGPQTEPLLTPLRPRRGPALIGDMAWQLARSPVVGTVFQTGIQGSVRHAPGNSGTDWHHLQWAGVASQRWGPWRAQLHGHATWVGGALNEPYRLARLGMSIDREAIGCSHRLTVEGEVRRLRTTRSADGQTTVTAWNSLCPLTLLGSDSAIGIAGRIGIDRADDPTRPGGDQRHASVGLRLLSTLGGGIRLDATLRATRVLDSEGYSPLLENGATRRLHQTQLTLELSKPLQLRWLYGAEALVQFQAGRQSSNLVIFNYEGLATYGGLRWRW